MILAAWIIAVVAGLGFIFVLLSKVPVIADKVVGRSRMLMLTDSFFGYIKRKFRLLGENIWHFILEAKDLKPPAPVNKITHMTQMPVDTVKKAFRIRIRQSEAEPMWMPEAAELAPTETVTDLEHRYLQLIKQNPKDIQAYEGLARLYLQEKNYNEAAEAFDYLTKLAPTKDVYWSNLGLSLFSTKRYREATAAYQKALDLNNKIPVRWINLALCLDSQEDTAHAIRAIAQAVQLDPRNINYLFLLADMYIKINNKVRAEETLNQILQIEPTNKPAREKLMKIKI